VPARHLDPAPALATGAPVTCSDWILMKALACEDRGGTQPPPSHHPEPEAFTMRCCQPPPNTRFYAGGDLHARSLFLVILDRGQEQLCPTKCGSLS
jgi:hypothetical protein